MAQYIDKDVLVAEIERLACPEHGSLCDKLLEFLDSLEVKEVGVDKEINEHAGYMPQSEFSPDSEVLENNSYNR